MSHPADNREVPDPPDIFRKKLVIVRCAAWFASRQYTSDGARALEWYLGSIDANGDIDIERGIDAAHLEQERTTIAEHNKRVADTGTAWQGPPTRPMREARAGAAATRKPPAERNIFTHA